MIYKHEQPYEGISQFKNESKSVEEGHVKDLLQILLEYSFSENVVVWFLLVTRLATISYAVQKYS